MVQRTDVSSIQQQSHETNDLFLFYRNLFSLNLTESIIKRRQLSIQAFELRKVKLQRPLVSDPV